MNNLTNFIYSYTCTYYFVGTPNPLAATFFRNFLPFCEIFLFCLRETEPAFIFFGLISLSFVCSLFGIYLTPLSIVVSHNVIYNI